MDEGERLSLGLQGKKLEKIHDWQRYGFSTRAIHDGQEADPITGAVTVPIYASSTFGQESPGRSRGYEYSRTDNPTRRALERSIASLEKAKYGLAFSSGMGAISTIGGLLRAGDHVLVCDDVYGGTFRVFTKVFSRFRVETDFVDATNTDVIKERLESNSYSFILIESPTNPLMKVIDISRCSKLAHSNGARVIVDNTFSSPYLTNPLALGADIVVHSTTKYLGGHSDVVGGAVAINDKELMSELKFLQNAIGAVPGPFDCWLVLRGIKTLSLRMQRHSDNAMSIASFLEKAMKKEKSNAGSVESINYPGLRNNPYHSLASRQMKEYGGMLSFSLGSKKAAVSFLERLKIFTIAESLGGVESLVELPAIMTHASIPKKEREARGITDSLIRISAGVEDKEDLLDDISRALRSVN